MPQAIRVIIHPRRVGCRTSLLVAGQARSVQPATPLARLDEPRRVRTSGVDRQASCPRAATRVSHRLPRHSPPGAAAQGVGSRGHPGSCPAPAKAANRGPRCAAFPGPTRCRNNIVANRMIPREQALHVFRKGNELPRPGIHSGPDERKHRGDPRSETRPFLLQEA